MNRKINNSQINSQNQSISQILQKSNISLIKVIKIIKSNAIENIRNN